jgi:competence protein ComEA
MRSRRSSQEQVAEVARRRLELLGAELAEIRPVPLDPPKPGDRDGSGEPVPGLDDAPTPQDDPRADPAPTPRPGRHAHRPVSRSAALAGWLEDRLPPTLQGRVRMSVAHLVVVVLVLLAGAGVTLWWVRRAEGSVTALPRVVTTASPLVPATTQAPAPAGTPTGTPTGSPTGGPAGGGPGAGASPGAAVVVDVTGKVRRPGIATLPPGARVVDALRAAGGARRGVSLASLNLARVLVDGEQVVVGVRSPTGTAPAAASVPAASPAVSGSAVPMVDINTATQAELEALPGVGPVTAQSILGFRAEHGTFTSVDELLEVSGIGDATLAKIAPYVTL